MAEVIPAEAVEAALSALFPNDASVQGFKRAVQEPIVRTILEAAAPFMLAAAWEQGHLAGSAGKLLEDEYPHLELTPNPYRPTSE